MSFINIFIQNPCKVYVKNAQLVLEGKEKMDWPLEDISAVLVESRECLISSYALSELSKHKIVVYFCDEKHMPTSYLLPFNDHYQPLKVQKAQLNIEKPLQKQLWQIIIKQKLLNQATVLQDINKTVSEELISLSQKVKSNDADNLEAVGALKYFKALFGNKFTRKNDSAINACLNYGYSIIRGAISRAVAVHGLNPAFGIFHKGSLNAFNLSDDIIEPFRPVVDSFVVQHINPNILELSPAIKHKLFNLLNVDVFIGKEKQPVKVAIDKVVQSFCETIENKKIKLVLPQLTELAVHLYE